MPSHHSFIWVIVISMLGACSSTSRRVDSAPRGASLESAVLESRSNRGDSLSWPSERLSEILEHEEPADDSDSEWTWTIGGEVKHRFLIGSTRVREFGSIPSRLNLRNELGLDEATGFHGEVALETGTSVWRIEADAFTSSGDGIRNQPFAYDEVFFAANQPYDTSARFFFGRGSWTAKLVEVEERGWFGPILGIEYANHSLGIDQPPTAETNEFYRQFIPYPVLGVGLRLPLTSSLDLDSQLVGTYLRSVPTPFNEGGRIKMSIGMIDIRTRLSWYVAEALTIDFGLGYLYFDSELRSGEDGNELTFYGPSISLGLSLHF